MTLGLAALGVLGVLIGSMLFFAAVVAPTVFRTLPAEHAGPFLRRLFPRYYAWGFVVAALATLLAALAGAAPAAIVVAALIALGFGVARQLLLPRINRARDAELAGDAAAGRRFARLHRLSVLLNLAQLLAAIGLFVALARL